MLGEGWGVGVQMIRTDCLHVWNCQKMNKFFKNCLKHLVAHSCSPYPQAGDWEFEVSLGWTPRPCLKTETHPGPSVSGYAGMGIWKRLRWEGRPDPELHCCKGCGTSQRQSRRLCLETKPQAFMLTSFLLYLNKLVLHLPHPQYPDLVWPILQTPFRSLVLLSHLSVLTTGYYWFLPETFKTTPVGLCYTL